MARHGEKVVDMIIDDDAGEFSAELGGFQGKDCVKEMDSLMAALGKETSRKFTQGAHQGVKAKQTVGGRKK